MNLEQYLLNKASRLPTLPKQRPYCSLCKKPKATCYCSAVIPFASTPIFAILIHSAEAKRSIATGRMSHLCLSNSFLFEGVDFSNHPGVNGLIKDPQNHCVVLAPGPNAINLSKLSPADVENVFPSDKRKIVFVIDGTWSQAGTMRRLSRNLQPLPTISFDPLIPSRFQIRKQPKAHCYSTIEAIHACLSLTQPPKQQPINNLLKAFFHLVNQQIQYENIFGSQRGFKSMRGERQPVVLSD